MIIDVYRSLNLIHKEISEELEKLKLKFKDMPRGRILLYKNGKYLKWYLCDGKNKSYIQKKSQKMANRLAAKHYNFKLIEELTLRKEALEKCLNVQKTIPFTDEILLKPSSPYCNLILSHFRGMQEDIVWENIQNDTQLLNNKNAGNIDTLKNENMEPQNERYPETLVHNTFLGHKVRSKSEVMIANALFSEGITYAYEKCIQLGDKNFYPDFTIFFPKKKELIYWEHFGMMDNPEYCEQAFLKLIEYGKAKIIPDINLITTFETREKPLDSIKVNQIIRNFFL